MKGLTKILLLISLLTASIRSYAQPTVTGVIYDADTQLVIGQLVEVYTDTTGTPFPYYNATYTGMDGSYSVTLPNNIPQGAIFRVKTIGCSIVHQSGGFLYPFTNIACNFMICATNKYISGTVTVGSQQIPPVLAMVYLLERHFNVGSGNYDVQKIDSLQLDTTSNFYNFMLPVSGNDSYYVKAALLPADTVNYLNYLPAYYNGGKLNWNSATVLPKENNTADVNLPAAVPGTGQGYIAGTVLEGANKSTAVGDSLYKRILILTDINDVPVSYTYSNTDGTFGFVALNYGTYKLFGDALGKCNPPVYFSLSQQNPFLIDILFEENDECFMGTIWPLSVNALSNDPVLSVYPNPVNDRLSISGLGKIEGEKNISLYSITGTLAFTTSLNDKDKLDIPFRGLTTGLYTLRITTAKGNYVFKISK